MLTPNPKNATMLAITLAILTQPQATAQDASRDPDDSLTKALHARHDESVDRQLALAWMLLDPLQREAVNREIHPDYYAELDLKREVWRQECAARSQINEAPDVAALRSRLDNTKIESIRFPEVSVSDAAATVSSVTGIPVSIDADLAAELDSSGIVLGIPTLTNWSIPEVLDILRAAMSTDFDSQVVWRNDARRVTFDYDLHATHGPRTRPTVLCC